MTDTRMLDACRRLRVALTLVECAVMDLHEAFVKRDAKALNEIERQTQAAIKRAKEKATR